MAMFPRSRWKVLGYHGVSIVGTLTPDLIVVDISPRTDLDAEWNKRVRIWVEIAPVLVFSAGPDFSPVCPEGCYPITGLESASDFGKIVDRALRHDTSADFTPSASRRPGWPESLTIREREVYRLIGLGKRNTQIAKDLRVSVKTVETHKEHLKQKLKLQSSAELLQSAIRFRR